MRALVLSLALLAASGCSVELLEDVAAETPENTCSANSDCGPSGVCQAGACVAPAGEFGTVLLEVTPPATTGGLGGAELVQVVHDLGSSSQDYELNLSQLTRVTGFVEASDPEAQAACLADARATLPVEVTFTPRERIFGLPSVSYSTQTNSDLTSFSQSELSRHPCAELLEFNVALYQFTLEVPAGDYDVYVRPRTDVLAAADVEACDAAPALFRGETIDAAEVCLPLSPGKPEQLDLTVNWNARETGASLEGWTADIVHPVTGHVLSDRPKLAAPSAANAEGVARHQLPLHFSLVAGEDFVDQGQELVRLTPPEGRVAPVIQLERSALEALGEASTPVLTPFPAPVSLQAWVWRKSDIDRGFEVPASATVTFTATELDGVAPGIFASFSTTVEVADDGKLTALVLPGKYVVRAVPAAGSGLAATEVNIDVPCARDPNDPDLCALSDPGAEPVRQSGRLLEMPDAASLSGTVRGNGGESIIGASVEMLPAQVRTRECPDDVDAGPACDGALLGVLEGALGEDAFVPRTAIGVVGDGGRFGLDELDCGRCEPDDGAFFDLFVRPPDNSGFAWLVRPSVSIETTTILPPLTTPLPIIHRGVTQVPTSGGEAVAVPGALIKAYILRDQSGAYVDDETLPSCAAREVTAVDPEARCIRSVLQIAETRARDDGTFELVLPSKLE